METKKIIECLEMCAEKLGCQRYIVGNCEENVRIGNVLDEAAERLEELDAELEKRTINDRPYEWISVEDERKPKEGESCIVRSSTDCITIRKYEKGGFPDNHRIRYWMHNPDLPKPKAKKFRKKPVVVDAYQTEKQVVIHTLEGDMTANVGDYIITGVNGEKYPCKPDIFEKTYEPYFEEEGDV